MSNLIHQPSRKFWDSSSRLSVMGRRLSYNTPKIKALMCEPFMDMQDKYVWIPKPWLIISNYLKNDESWACSTVQTGLVSISLGRAITGLWYLDLKMWSLEASWKISLARLSCPLLNNVLPKLFILWDNLAASIPSLSIDLKSRLPSFFLPRLFMTIPLKNLKKKRWFRLDKKFKSATI